MADFTRHSAYRQYTTLYGGTESTFEELRYEQLTHWKRWYLRDSYAYAAHFSRLALAQRHTHVDVQNRPLIFHYLANLLPKNIRLSLHLHNDPQGMTELRLARKRQAIADRATHVYCVSDYIRQRFIDGLTRHQHKVVVVHNGIDTQRYLPERKLNTIVYVGRIIQEKGALPLAEAFALVANELPDWHFIVCGVDRFEVKSEYERLTHAFLAKLGKQCHYVGYIDHPHVMRQFGQAAIAAVPSVWQEPFGRTALEAMCGGAALITSASGGIREVVGDSGSIVNPTPAELATAILRLARDNDLRAHQQQRGRQRAMEFFDIRVVAAQLDQLRSHP